MNFLLTEIKDLLTPTERAFRGLSIAFLLYFAGALVCSLMVQQLTKAHLIQRGGDSDSDKAKIEARLHKVNSYLLKTILILLFSLLFSLTLYNQYKGVEGKGPSLEIDDDIVEQEDSNHDGNASQSQRLLEDSSSNNRPNE